jgi:hypothetical protein
MTSSGQKFRTISGEGDPPAEVSWDGRDDSGKPLTPGEQYAYSFTAIDKAGNRRTFPGDGFSVPALYLKNEQGIWIGISNSLLFSSEGYGLTPSAKNYSKELINFVYYYADQKQIRIRSPHPACDQFIDLLNQYLGEHYYVLEKETGDNILKNCMTLIIK